LDALDCLGNERFFGHETNQLMLGVAAAGERGARASDGCQLDEISTIHGVLT
jgi:hypothetical protein